MFSAEQKKVFYKDAADKLVDAATGTPVAGARRPISTPCASTTGCAA